MCYGDSVVSRLNRRACLEVFVALAFCFTLSTPAMSQASLETVRGIYQQYTTKNFDDGGEISHYVWKNFSRFSPKPRLQGPGPSEVFVARRIRR